MIECLAIGSLPYSSADEAMNAVKTYFPRIPFWPQLAKVNRNEDMTIQFLEGMPSFSYSEDFCFNAEDEKFYEDLEQFFMDYETIISGDYSLLDKYKITYSSAFPLFIDLLKQQKTEFGKGQIVGPFTLATTLTDKSGRCAIYDDTLKEIIVKTLTLKALWQVEQIKATGAKPIIFIDEPSLSQLGTSAYLTISTEDVIIMMKEITDIIHANGGLSAIHCCGKCDWSVPILSGIDMVSLDAYSFSENLSIYKKHVKKFLENGGKVVWGVVPTLDKIALQKADLDMIIEKFDEAVKYLTKKGIDEKLIISNSYVSPSCGAGSLSVELAEKAMKLTFDLSEKLKERYNDN